MEIAIELSSGYSQGLVWNPLRTHDMSSSSVLMMTGIGVFPNVPPPHRFDVFPFPRDLFQIPCDHFSGGVQRFFLLGKVNYRALVWALVVSSQCKSVVSLSSTGTLHPAPQMAVGWGSTLRLSKLQWSSPLRLIQTNVGVDKNPWQKCVKYIIYAFFEGKEHQYNLHTSSTVKQCVGRTQ